jgi:hypothetical protein
VDPGSGIRHPWETARRDFIVSLLTKAGLTTSAEWLDVGSGDAWLAREIASALPSTANVTCCDAFYTHTDLDDLASTEGPAVHYVSDPAGVEADVMLLLDVLEHVEDDTAFLSELVAENLRADGRVLITVPAHQRLFSAHDVALQHHRRYSARGCREVIDAAGLEVEHEGGFFHALLAARCLTAGLEKLKGSGNDEQGVGGWSWGPGVTKLIHGVLRTETRVSEAVGFKGLYIPGLSYWALCRPRPQ